MADREVKPASPAVALSNAWAALVVGLVVCELTIGFVVGLPALLGTMLVSDQGDSALLIALSAATLLGALGSFGIGRVFGGRRELHWAFVAGPLVFALQMLTKTIVWWSTSDTFGRTMLLPYVVGTAALAAGFFWKRRERSPAEDVAQLGEHRPA